MKFRSVTTGGKRYYCLEPCPESPKAELPPGHSAAMPPAVGGQRVQPAARQGSSGQSSGDSEHEAPDQQTGTHCTCSARLTPPPPCTRPNHIPPTHLNTSACTSRSMYATVKSCWFCCLCGRGMSWLPKRKQEEKYTPSLRDGYKAGLLWRTWQQGPGTLCIVLS